MVQRRAAVITVSDRVSRGEATDVSGPAVADRLREAGYEVVSTSSVPDDGTVLSRELVERCASAALVVTTGGTGLGPRDRTPEATRQVCDYDIPGLAEEMRRVGRVSTPMALLSRGVVMARGGCLVLNLPGSPRGAVESLDAVLAVLDHALALLDGYTDHPTGTPQPAP
ncbi:MAG: MogA/MoaB family molybdenum cofactor biosynthesis protein [Candidatus Dormibacteria bacterium]